ncbi:hypothetical protein A5697_14095 [Mycobacterium sp. E3251]|uniref:hypothetical protein n=1 Tax=unclassified Mycobacterium TaxID=2642494 RepID=UPI0007FC43AF|nr:MULTISPECIES: hypothetical protein [unclassified Mycobacterium]OBG99257.1 hypothetical protein A5697_14095 [Mycobacterium sp. E3251]OBI28741.1 hypothetical protein A5709_03350 [Mycobacterium sp. E1386]OBI33670.1 hypothetical protein A5711_18270 [Mycobacterium sp. E2238]
MRSARAAFVRLYGSRPWHLLTLIAGLALLAYVVATIKPVALWNPQVWWQSIIVWFAAAIVAHDLVLFPIYALFDRLLSRSVVRLAPRGVPVINHIRVPALGAGLTLLVFLPGIIKQGAATYSAATGQTQDPFLGRWLLLTAAMFGASAAIYAVRVVTAPRRTGAAPDLHVGDDL